MVEIEKPRIECVENPGDASYGKYVVEPLERGYGTTLGNSLRRILLSSLPGTAVTSIKIAGVQHEFSTIPGVKEDVTEIVLNIKSIIAKLHCEETKRNPGGQMRKKKSEYAIQLNEKQKVKSSTVSWRSSSICTMRRLPVCPARPARTC